MACKPKKNLYHIILVNHGKQLRDLFFTPSESKVNKEFTKMLNENKKVVFPMMWNNEKHVMVEAEYELVIIKGKEHFDSPVSKLRDGYGKFINYESSDDDWVIYDKAPYYLEESFWVYGYHPKLQRKDFNWIFDSFITKDAKNKYMFKSVQVYNNKVLIDCNGKLEMVICKNKKDAIRMYNMIEELATKKKYKYITFMGDVGASKYVSSWIDRIQELTHWSRQKIKRPSTRP